MKKMWGDANANFGQFGAAKDGRLTHVMNGAAAGNSVVPGRPKAVPAAGPWQAEDPKDQRLPFRRPSVPRSGAGRWPAVGGPHAASVPARAGQYGDSAG